MGLIKSLYQGLLSITHLKIRVFIFSKTHHYQVAAGAYESVSVRDFFWGGGRTKSPTN